MTINFIGEWIITLMGLLLFVLILSTAVKQMEDKRNEAIMIPKDIASLGPEEKTIVENYLANSGSPITYGEFDRLMAEHRTAAANSESIEAQKTALKDQH
jgi:hypothetical protein